ncbi:MAG: Histone-like Protein p6 [Bacteriophage sp.]|nr:MAG: Histone-like Protein p6 [Bacteriophage sp.]
MVQLHSLVFAPLVHVTTSYNKLQQVTKQNSLQNKEDKKMRKPSVTRRISSLNVTVLGMDIVSCESMTKTYPVYESEVPRDEAKLFNYIRKMYETDTFKISAIIDKTRVTKTYAMSLSKFIEEADTVDAADTADTADAADAADKADKAQ